MKKSILDLLFQFIVLMVGQGCKSVGSALRCHLSTQLACEISHIVYCIAVHSCSVLSTLYTCFVFFVDFFIISVLFVGL